LKTKVVIIGSGNVGYDLVVKISKNPYLEVGLLTNLRYSPGLQRADKLGIPVSDRGIQAFIENPDAGDIVFDATTAKAHLEHAPILRKLGKIAIDLTPAGVGTRVVPAFNLEENLDKDNISLISCGGQAVIPIAWAINQVVKVKYAEIISASASKSVGIGTRDNIDEYTQITARGMVEVAKVQKAKVIIILNPAEPPIAMHNTIFTIIEELDDEIKDKIEKSVRNIEKKIRSYVPGYRISTPPQFSYEDKLVTTMVEVEGAGDSLPRYAGNLDIITQAAVAVGESFAKKLSKGE